jgi:hypothetical protein
LIIAASQVVVLVLLLSFHRSAVLPFVLPVIQLVIGDAATHYPLFFFALPAVFSRVDLAISALVASLMVGIATLMFASVYHGKSQEGAWKTALKRYPVLLGTTIVMLTVLFLVSKAQSLVPQDSFRGNAMIRWGTRAGVLLVFILVQSLFAYGSAWIVLRGRSVLAAIRDSIRLAWRTLLPTFLLIAIPTLLLYPINYLTGRPDLIADKFRPETMVGILGVKIALEVILGFLLVGAITRVFLYRLEEAQ